MSPAARHRAMLRDRSIAALRAGLAGVAPDARVLLFGSLARGDFDGASDADLLVISDARPDWSLDAALGRAVDMLHWTPAQWQRALADGHPFAQDVTREGIILWPPESA